MIFIFLNGCWDSTIEYQQALKEDAQIKPDQLANSITVNFFENNWTKAILTADRAEIYQSTQQTHIIGNVVVEYFSKTSGKRLSRLSCDSAIVDDNTKDMQALGNVVVFVDSSNIKLQTSKLFWNNEKQIVNTNEFITITTPNETIYGYGFESDLNFSFYKIYKVSGIKQ